MRKLSFYLTTIASLLAMTLPAHAYLDPASGSMILQLILGGIAGVALAVKLYWQKALGFFGRKKQKSDDGTA